MSTEQPTADARPDTDALRADADWLREWALSKVNHTKADRLEEAADWIDAQPVRGDGPADTAKLRDLESDLAHELAEEGATGLLTNVAAELDHLRGDGPGIEELAASVKNPWIVHDPVAEDWYAFPTETQAVECAQSIIDGYGGDVWPDEVDEIVVTQVRHIAVERVIARRDDVGEDEWAEITGGSDSHIWSHYHMTPTAAPPATSRPDPRPYPERPAEWLRVGQLREAIATLNDDAPITVAFPLVDPPMLHYADGTEAGHTTGPDGLPARYAFAQASDADGVTGTDPMTESTLGVLVIGCTASPATGEYPAEFRPAPGPATSPEPDGEWYVVCSASYSRGGFPAEDAARDHAAKCAYSSRQEDGESCRHRVEFRPAPRTDER